MSGCSLQSMGMSYGLVLLVRPLIVKAERDGVHPGSCRISDLAWVPSVMAEGATDLGVLHREPSLLVAPALAERQLSLSSLCQAACFRTRLLAAWWMALLRAWRSWLVSKWDLGGGGSWIGSANLGVLFLGAQP